MFDLIATRTGAVKVPLMWDFVRLESGPGDTAPQCFIGCYCGHARARTSPVPSSRIR